MANGNSKDKLFAFREKRPGMDTLSETNANRKKCSAIESNIKKLNLTLD